MAFYICAHCGYGSGSWLGRCPDCGQFNTFKKQSEPDDRSTEPVKKLTPTRLSSLPSLNTERKKTGIYEFDRVVGGGIVPGAVILLTGEPGVGKSTLLLQVLHKLRTLYISGEEVAEQVRDRAERLGVDLESFYFSDILQIEGILQGVNDIKADIDIVVIDSIQTVYSKNVDGIPGSITQLREAGNTLVQAAKKLRIPFLIIGHVTKEGEIAGPRTLEHMVDAVISFEGEKVSQFRVLRASKNRFGSTDEIGIFEMTPKGLQEVTNPLAFVEDEAEGVPGKAIVGITEGRRPLFFEIQTLASPTVLAIPRRVVKGIDYNKLLLLLAVIRKHLNLSLDKYDIYVNVIGGVDIRSTGADLGIIASLISSIRNKPLPPKSLFIGEVGLLGEVRKVYGDDRIVGEARRLAFAQVYSYNNVKTIQDLNRYLINPAGEPAARWEKTGRGIKRRKTADDAPWEG